MKAHELKLDSVFYDAVLDGRKTFEIRYNDRGYQAGDIVELRKWSTEYHCYTEPYAPIRKQISYVLSGYGLKEGWVCFGIIDIPEEKK